MTLGRSAPGRRQAEYRETHAGAILRIRQQIRYAQVPHALLRDERLPLDAKGLAGYLLALPHDWQIVVTVLKRELRLGDDRWQRLAGQLEAAGYLARCAIPAARGVDDTDKGYAARWQWVSVFDPDGGAAAALVDELKEMARAAELQGDQARHRAITKAAAKVAFRVASPESPRPAFPGPGFPGPEKQVPKEVEVDNKKREKKERTRARDAKPQPQGTARRPLGRGEGKEEEAPLQNEASAPPPAQLTPAHQEAAAAAAALLRRAARSPSSGTGNRPRPEHVPAPPPERLTPTQRAARDAARREAATKLEKLKKKIGGGK